MTTTRAHQRAAGRGYGDGADDLRNGAMSIISDKSAKRRLSFDPRAIVLSRDSRKIVAFHGK